jgi:hypothetical protein
MSQPTTLITIEAEVKPVILQAERLQVIDELSLTTATELLSQANTLLKQTQTHHKVEAEPFEFPLKEIDTRYSPTEKALKNIIASIRLSIGSYQTKVTQLLKEQELAIASRIAPGKGNLSLDSAVARIENLDKPIERVIVNSGSLSFREKQTLKIVDSTIIPREYLVPDEDKILDVLKAGQSVAGCEIEVVQVPINRRA